jgi:NAD+ synthase (glutamine-hydrolysing)
MKSLNILMAQINPTVGAIEKNVKKILDIIIDQQSQYDLIIFPELCITGYPPEDLLYRKDLYDRVNTALSSLQQAVKDCHVIVGHPTLKQGEHFNSASIFFKRQCITTYHKQILPNYGVFDEARYFTNGPSQACRFEIQNHPFGLCICEDLWHPGPMDLLIESGAKIIVCINASPFDHEKYELRENLLKQYALRGIMILYVNQVGGQDELVFDGQSLAMNSKGDVCARAISFEENLLPVQLNLQEVQGTITPLLSKEQFIYKALMTGLRDYVEKNGFPGVLIGLSGGIDSALTLAIAVDALGASNVHAVMMPSRYTADISSIDALQQLKILQVEHSTLSIEPAFTTLLSTLAPEFAGLKTDTTEENLQARIRGMLLMALSNKTGKMVLTTSNKSETAVGYATLYGDMAGGFAVLKDVLKTQVYALARYRNQISPVIPERVIIRAPSAELAPNQTDQDSLPDYETLDAIIKLYMENNLDEKEIISQGFHPEVVNTIIRRIIRNEYKRRQAAPGVKISSCAFGRDWRYPLTSGFLKSI